eukprot:m.235009 g.235009  ORF g.235009 m.235009 type:complete len:55 (+) comp19856_c0_seq1:1037-1201(+)
MSSHVDLFALLFSCPLLVSAWFLLLFCVLQSVESVLFVLSIYLPVVLMGDLCRH